MAAALPHPHSEVVDELHPEPQVTEEEEIVDLHKPDEPPAPAPKAEEKPAEEPAPAPAAEEDDDIPAEWRGKSQRELAKMLRDAQQVIGRQGNELGEFRKKADLLIQASLANLAATRGQAPAAQSTVQPTAPVSEEKLDDVEFFRSPSEAIAKAIAASPIIKEIKATLGQAAATQAEARALAATQRFNAAHPDAAEIMADPEFRKWVGASRVRTALLQRAHSQYDFDSGDEVFGTWKALKGIKSGAPAAAASAAQPAASAAIDPSAAARALAKRKEELKAAGATPTAGNAAPRQSIKKIYRRADVIKLMQDDPDRYEQLAPELERAYAEGRVR